MGWYPICKYSTLVDLMDGLQDQTYNTEVNPNGARCKQTKRGSGIPRSLLCLICAAVLVAEFAVTINASGSLKLLKPEELFALTSDKQQG
jgi:hypothetical protein